jgi:hypothetical protein
MKKKIKKSGAGHGPVQPSKGSAPGQNANILSFIDKFYGGKKSDFFGAI